MNDLNNVSDKGMPEDEDGNIEQINEAELRAHNERIVDEFLSQGDIEAPEVEQDLPAGHKSGFVAVVGKPNVGKSTLMNALLGEKLAIVSAKPQTTRENQIGILTENDRQIVFVDTPGIHKARTKLGKFMVDSATATLSDADVILFMVDISEPPSQADSIIAEMINGIRDAQVVLAMNKVDLLDHDLEGELADLYTEFVPGAQPLTISALKGGNQQELLDVITSLLPEGPRYYPSEQLTEMHVRENVAEIIREQVLELYQHEIPHSTAVKVNEFKERENDVIYIAATVYVERDSQKRILIGKQGSALKALGQQARVELERLLDNRVYLELWVKVMKNWRKDDNSLEQLGYSTRK